jgi:hypothetical protein
VEETVDLIKSFRTGELEEWLDKENEKLEKQALQKDNVPTEKVVKIIRDLREIWLRKVSNGSKAENSSQQKEMQEMAWTETEIKERLEEARRRMVSRELKQDIRPLTAIERGVKLMKPITEAEFNYYNDVNQSCATRLAIANLEEKLKTPNKKGRKKVSDDDETDEAEVIVIDNSDSNEEKEGSYESRRRNKHAKKKIKKPAKN